MISRKLVVMFMHSSKSRGLDVRVNFKTISTSFGQRALHKNEGKCSKILVYLYCQNGLQIVFIFHGFKVNKV